MSPPPDRPAPRRVIVLRHGRTAWNVQGRFQGRDHPDDPPLDDVGRDQAARAAAALADVGATLLLSSPLRRARQTADAVAATTGLPVRNDDRLREQAFGRWEGLTRDEVAAAFPDEFAEWQAGQEPTRAGGERRSEVGRRMVGAVDALPPGAVAVIVTHGAAGAALVAHLVGIGDAARRIGGLGNCHTSTLHEGVDGWSLRNHNLPTAAPA